jgi:hypothetical protein
VLLLVLLLVLLQLVKASVQTALLPFSQQSLYIVNAIAVHGWQDWGWGWSWGRPAGTRR